MPFFLPKQQCQSTEGKISHSMDLLTPSSPGGLPTLSLTTNSSWLPWGRVAMPLISPVMPVPLCHSLLLYYLRSSCTVSIYTQLQYTDRQKLVLCVFILNRSSCVCLCPVCQIYTRQYTCISETLTTQTAAVCHQ